MAIEHESEIRSAKEIILDPKEGDRILLLNWKTNNFNGAVRFLEWNNNQWLACRKGSLGLKPYWYEITPTAILDGIHDDLHIEWIVIE